MGVEESLATKDLHWVKIFLPVKPRNGYEDNKMSAEPPTTMAE